MQVTKKPEKDFINSEIDLFSVVAFFLSAILGAEVIKPHIFVIQTKELLI